MGEYIPKLHFITGDGDGGTIHSDFRHLHDQHITVFVVGIDQSITSSKTCEGFIRIFDDVNPVFLIRTGHHIGSHHLIHQLRSVRADQEVGLIAAVQIQNLFCVIVRHRGIQQFLHFPGIQRAVQ